MIETNISTTSELLQEKSSTECVSTETGSMTTVQNDELIFGQKHNDIDCALYPTAKRACDRAWVTAKQIEEWSKMSTTTLWRWLERLEKARRIASFSDMKKTPIQDSCGVSQQVGKVESAGSMGLSAANQQLTYRSISHDRKHY